MATTDTEQADLSPGSTPEVARGPLDRAGERFLEFGPVRWLKPILDNYDRAGGGLLAAGLAFNSLFAILPSILLLIALIGVFLGQPDRLEAMSTYLSAGFPPLTDFVRQALDSFTAGAVTYSILGVIALVWGASRFYQSLDDAMARIFDGSPRRDAFARGLRGVLSVVLLAGVVGAVILLSNLLTNLSFEGLPGVFLVSYLLASTLGSAAASISLFALGMALIYRLVPTRRPSWSAVSRPALVVGAATALFTALFAVLTPRLVGGLAVYGAFVAVFAAMIWLSFVSQALLVGASWVYRRTLHEEARVEARKAESAAVLPRAPESISGIGSGKS